ncbi:uncharacterized protein AB9W97_009746 [Spinachia spinachia]
MEAANGTPIRTYGTRYIELCFGGHRFGWDFVTARVAVPLLAADFLCKHGLLVDVKNRIDAVTFCSYSCTLSGADSIRLSSMLSPSDDFHRLLAGFPELTQPTFSASAVKHGVEHHIATTGPPVYARAWRLDPTELAVAKAEFSYMKCLGIVCRSYSPWASPLHIVPKPAGAHVATTGGLMRQRHPTNTQSRTYRIFQHTYHQPNLFSCNGGGPPGTSYLRLHHRRAVRHLLPSRLL